MREHGLVGARSRRRRHMCKLHSAWVHDLVERDVNPTRQQVSAADVT